MSKKALCIKNCQAKKCRKEFVQSLMSLDKLKKLDGNHVYYLTHTYNSNPNRKIYFQAPYDLDTINAICAYIQFECSEIEMSYSMDESEVIEILEKFYDCSSSFSVNKGDVKTAQGIDLYINWEAHCGSDVQGVRSLKRNGMDKFFKRYIDSF